MYPSLCSLQHLSRDSGCFLIPRKCPGLPLSSRSRYSVSKDRNKSIHNKDTKSIHFGRQENIYFVCKIRDLAEIVPVDPDGRAFFGISTAQNDPWLLGLADWADDGLSLAKGALRCPRHL